MALPRIAGVARSGTYGAGLDTRVGEFVWSGKVWDSHWLRI